MTEALILMLGGVFARELIQRLEKEHKDSLTKKEIFQYITEVAFELAKKASERNPSASTFDPSKN